MGLVEKYIVLYAVAILFSGLLLMVVGVQQIEVYYAAYFIGFLVAVEMVASLRRSLERNLATIFLVFLLGFIYTIVERILQILS